MAIKTSTDPYTIIIPTRGQADDFTRIKINFSSLPTDLPLIVVANRNFTTLTAGLADRPNTRVFFVPGGGVARVRNIGMWVAETDILVFIDDDVSPNMASIDILVNRLTSSTATVATARIRSSTAHDQISELYQWFFNLDRGDTSYTFDEKFGKNLSPMKAWSLGVGAAFAINRSSFKRIAQLPMFDETLSNGRYCGGAEDVDFFFQCAQAGLVVEYCAEATFLHR